MHILGIGSILLILGLGSFRGLEPPPYLANGAIHSRDGTVEKKVESGFRNFLRIAFRVKKSYPSHIYLLLSVPSLIHSMLCYTIRLGGGAVSTHNFLMI